MAEEHAIHYGLQRKLGHATERLASGNLCTPSLTSTRDTPTTSRNAAAAGVDAANLRTVGLQGIPCHFATVFQLRLMQRGKMKDGESCCRIRLLAYLPPACHALVQLQETKEQDKYLRCSIDSDRK